MSAVVLALGLLFGQAGLQVPAHAAEPVSLPVDLVPEPPRPAIDIAKTLPALAERPDARVLLVMDGDTLRLADRRTIRLACVDAPDLALSRPIVFKNQELRVENFRLDEDEPKKPKPEGRKRQAGREQYFAAEAQQALKKLATRQAVSLRAPLTKKDPQGRLVADIVLVETNTSLSAFLVENGFAYVVDDPDFPRAYVDTLFALQARAIAARRGFWGRILSLEKARQPWVGNSETHLFYASSDVRSRQIKPRLRAYFGTLLDAFSANYAPASSGDFWPNVDKGEDSAKKGRK